MPIKDIKDDEGNVVAGVYSPQANIPSSLEDELEVLGINYEHASHGKGCRHYEEYSKSLKALKLYCNKQIVEVLKPLLPEMNADDYGVWVRGQIVDRIKELGGAE